MNPNPQLCNQCNERPISSDMLFSGLCCICTPVLSRAERKRLLIAEFEHNQDQIMVLCAVRRNSGDLLELCKSHTEIGRLMERNEDISEYLRYADREGA